MINMYESALEKAAHRIWDNKIGQIIKNICMSLLFGYGILQITYVDSMIYQTHKDAAMAKGVLAIMVIIFMLQKVRLINLPSLITIAIYIPVLNSFLSIYRESPDLLAIYKPNGVTYLLGILMLVDFVCYKKVNPLRNIKPLPLVLYLGMIFVLLTHNNAGTGVYFVVPLLFLYMTDMTEDEWQNTVERLCDGVLLSYIVVFYRSFTEFYPYDTERFYGCFTNIGLFGAFLTCVFMVFLYRFYSIRNTRGIKSPLYWVHWILFISLIYLMLLVNTITMVIGIFVALVVYLVYSRKKVTKEYLFRVHVLLLIIVALGVVSFVGINYYANHSTVLEQLAYKTGDGLLYSTLYRILACVGGRQVIGGGLDQYEGALYAINELSSGRLYIWDCYSEFFNLFGNVEGGVLVGEQTIINAHNEFVQAIYRYGYIGSMLYFSVYLYGLWNSVLNYVRYEQKTKLFEFMWLCGMIAVWMGERNSITYPITFIGAMLLYGEFKQRDKEIKQVS